MSSIFESISWFFESYTTWSVIARMVVAVLCGGIIGMERGRHGRAAGLRTHILVSVGAAISAIVGLYTTEVLGYSNDPLRVGAQVISGIGFLGVGSILVVGRSHVRGLTTAAGLWTTASIGLACGIGYVQLAVAAVIIVLLTMTVMTKLEKSAQFEVNSKRYYIEVTEVAIVNELVDELRREFSAADISVTAPRSGIAGNLGIEVAAPRLNMKNQETELTSLQNRDYVVIAVEAY